MSLPLPEQTLTVNEYLQMVADGVFSEDARIELIHGEIVEMSPIGDRHIASLIAGVRVFARLLPRVDLSPQSPLRVRGFKSLPQPDLVLVRPRKDYRLRPPGASDVVLLVEIADSSLAYDRDVKMPLYAGDGIPEFWLVDLNSETIFAYRRPSLGGYQEIREYRRGSWISPQAFPDERFLVDDLLG